MIHYKCYACDYVFSERAALVRVEFDTSEFWGRRMSRQIESILCPKCGECDLDDFAPCKAGCEEEAMDGDDYCALCAQAIEEDHPSSERIARERERITDEVLDVIIGIARQQ